MNFRITPMEDWKKQKPSSRHQNQSKRNTQNVTKPLGEIIEIPLNKSIKKGRK